MVELPQFRELLHQRRDELLGRFERRQRIGDDERFHAGERIERHLRHHALVQLFDIHAAVMRERHGRRPEMSGVADGEIHLVLRRHCAFECHTVRLGELVAVAVLDEVKPFLFLQRCLQILRATEQSRLAFLAHAALEYRLDEDRAVTLDERLDLLFAGVWSQHFGRWKAGELQQFRAVEHACNLHRFLLAPHSHWSAASATRRKCTTHSLFGYRTIESWTSGSEVGKSQSIRPRNKRKMMPR